MMGAPADGAGRPGALAGGSDDPFQGGNTMKKLLCVALLLALSLAVVAHAESADLLARIRERGTLVIATEGNWQPWTYHD